LKLSDIIEDWIKDVLKDEQYIDLQRNELANQFNCVPSQINYVIDTRFNNSNGYYVESRRGGGGYIRIKKIDYSKGEYIMNLVNSIEDSITNNETQIILNSLYKNDFATETEIKLMKVATNDKVLQLNNEIKDNVRACILKNMLINLL